MTKAKVFGAWANGTWTEVKAFKKANAVTRFQELDATIKAGQVSKTSSVNSHQVPVDEA